MNDDRVWDLWTRWMTDGNLSREEQRELLDDLGGNEGLRTKLLEDRRMEGMLRGRIWASMDAEGFRKEFSRRLEAQRDATRFIKKVESQLQKEKAPTQGGPPQSTESPMAPVNHKRPPSTRRSVRQSRFQSPRSNWLWTLVAAGFLFAVFVLITLVSSGSDPNLAHKTPHREPVAQRPAERDRLERERALAEAQAKRLEGEAQLREIEEKRRVLTQAKPEAVQDPQAQAKREKDLAELKRDQERIEQELKDAVQLAKKIERPAPATPFQEEKPQPLPAAPSAPSQGTTQAELAKVEEISGEAFVVTKEGKSPVSAGANLLPGQGLETGGGASRIVLRFSDKTRVDLGPETVLAEVKTDSGKRLALTQGTVRAVVAKQPKGEALIFTTPHGQAKVVGTTLRLVVDPDPKKGTELEVEEGKVELKNLVGKTVMVESGHYAVAAVGVELVARVFPSRPRPAAFVWSNPQQPWGAILQTVTLVPGQTYTLSVWIQTSTPDPNKATGQFPGGSIGVRTESGSILAQQPFGQSESYARTVLSFKSSSTSIAVIFAGFANGSDAQAWIHADDWSLLEKGGDGTNLIQDPDYKGQNQVPSAPLSGPWFSEGLSKNFGIGLNPSTGRVLEKRSGGERK